ncbi:MAG: FixG Ig-like domain-containing protein [Pseudomonadota bacterium]
MVTVTQYAHACWINRCDLENTYTLKVINKSQQVQEYNLRFVDDFQCVGVFHFARAVHSE